MEKFRTTLATCALIALLSMVGLLLVRMTDVERSVIESLNWRNKNMQSMTAGPWLSGGIPYSITTTRNEDETPAAFTARHLEAVDALLEARPKDE